MSSSITIKIPIWLDMTCVWPVLLYRWFKYGYTYRRIYLGEGQWAKVDEDIYYKFGHLKWCAVGDDGKKYAARIVEEANSRRIKTEYLHRKIMNPPEGLLVDHKNGDRLDDRLDNLRLATHSQNACNSRRDKTRTLSRYRGVSYSKRKGKWFAAIRNKGKKVWLGYFENEIDAARAYDEAAKKYQPEFGVMNFS
jgi:hypothetical protein